MIHNLCNIYNIIYVIIIIDIFFINIDKIFKLKIITIPILILFLFYTL